MQRCARAGARAVARAARIASTAVLASAARRSTSRLTSGPTRPGRTAPAGPGRPRRQPGSPRRARRRSPDPAPSPAQAPPDGSAIPEAGPAGPGPPPAARAVSTSSAPPAEDTSDDAPPTTTRTRPDRVYPSPTGCLPDSGPADLQQAQFPCQDRYSPASTRCHPPNAAPRESAKLVGLRAVDGVCRWCQLAVTIDRAGQPAGGGRPPASWSATYAAALTARPATSSCRSALTRTAR